MILKLIGPSHATFTKIKNKNNIWPSTKTSTIASDDAKKRDCKEIWNSEDLKVMTPSTITGKAGNRDSVSTERISKIEDEISEIRIGLEAMQSALKDNGIQRLKEK